MTRRIDRMSISEQVKELRYKADIFEKSGCAVDGIVKAFRNSADTIETLSAKLAVANMERSDRYYGGGWILCSDRTPDEDGLYIIHVVTGTGENDVGTCLYQRGTHLSGKQTYIDDKQGYWASPYNGNPVNEYLTQNVIAWQPLPEPYYQ